MVESLYIAIARIGFEIICSSKVLLNQASSVHLINKKITNKFLSRKRG